MPLKLMKEKCIFAALEYYKQNQALKQILDT
jgi:hypothetical protein